VAGRYNLLFFSSSSPPVLLLLFSFTLCNPQGAGGAGERERKEDQWEAVSGQLSGLLQGGEAGGLEGDPVLPFDAASDVPIEEQKVKSLVG
jgi:hypothetical protein